MTSVNVTAVTIIRQHNVHQLHGPTTIVVNSNEPGSKISNVSTLGEAPHLTAAGKAFDLADHPPCQPVVRYPTATTGGKQRSFNAE